LKAVCSAATCSAMLISWARCVTTPSSFGTNAYTHGPSSSSSSS
jgi:hypothetical protein